MSVTENNFCYFSTKTYVVGTQKNHLNETVLLSTQNMFRLLGKQMIAFLRSKILLNWTYVVTHWEFFSLLDLTLLNEAFNLLQGNI